MRLTREGRFAFTFCAAIALWVGIRHLTEGRGGSDREENPHSDSANRSGLADRTTPTRAFPSGSPGAPARGSADVLATDAAADAPVAPTADRAVAATPNAPVAPTPGQPSAATDASRAGRDPTLDGAGR